MSGSKKAQFRCSECGWITGKWIGRCTKCKAYSTMVEESTEVTGRTKVSTVSMDAPTIAQIDSKTAAFSPTGEPELDRVLGGGLIPGAVILMAGEPGVGKSTLLLNIASKVAWKHQDEKVLYVTGEESAGQVKLRAERIEALAPNLHVAAETDLSRVLGYIEQMRPKFLIVDSVQTMHSLDVDGTPGGVTQIRETTASLIAQAKKLNMTTMLVGHVTKDGNIAGPRLLEHLVDVVTHFEGERTTQLRFLRAIKNRFGSTDELGCFTLNEGGIEGLSDPSGLFMNQFDSKGIEGSCVTVTLDGARALPAEIQSLLVETFGGGPRRRSVAGLDYNRVDIILAVLQQVTNIQVPGFDTFVSTLGGIRITEPAADLAILISIYSSVMKMHQYDKAVVIGEVGLAGDVRSVPGVSQRLREAYRLGFTTAVIPATAELGNVPEDMKIVRVANVLQALSSNVNA